MKKRMFLDAKIKASRGKMRFLEGGILTVERNANVECDEMKSEVD